MTFDELLALASSNNVPGLCTDSRLVGAGGIFVAIKGTVCDGHDFIDEAVAKGAKYIISQKLNTQHATGSRRASAPRNTQYETIIVDDSAEAAALLAQAGCGSPSSQLTNLAVTGTNGKTTVVFLVRSVIQSAGQKCGLIGTVVYDTGLASSQASLTTPDCLAIAKAQQQMVAAGARYMVIEASSHSLSQNRLAAVNFKAAAFTNLGGDHLDYHKTEKDYLAAKSVLFENLSDNSTAVLNKQSPHAVELASKTKAEILWYAIDEPADITGHIESMDINGTFYVLEYAGQRQKVTTPLFGRYNVSNHLAAAGLCLAAGFDLETTSAGLSALKIVPGRLEKLDYTSRKTRAASHELTVLIDYAHTDDALKNVLTTLKGLCKGRLILVFGCGGDRDRTKRPRMARVAEQWADFIIVTSDNPRTERPEDIINEMVAGFERVDSKTITVVPDRKKAIELAVNTAAENDIVLIAGKGHETYQIIGTQKFDFNDRKTKSY